MRIFKEIFLNCKIITAFSVILVISISFACNHKVGNDSAQFEAGQSSTANRFDYNYQVQSNNLKVHTGTAAARDFIDSRNGLLTQDLNESNDEAVSGSVSSPEFIGESEAVTVLDENLLISSEKVLVCLDPGHPSEVNDGMTVQNGVTENNINWLIAVEMREFLEEHGVNVAVTKSEEEEFLTNEERVNIANEEGAVLFFRIHCDSGPESARGMTFYYPDRQGTWDGHTGPPEELIPFCEEAAYTIHDSAMEELDGLLNDRGVRTDNDTNVGARQGGALRGSILSRVPVVLVEVCFLSNAEDAALVSDSETRSDIVRALSRGIMSYLDGIKEGGGEG